MNTEEDLISQKCGQTIAYQECATPSNHHHHYPHHLHAGVSVGGLSQRQSRGDLDDRLDAEPVEKAPKLYFPIIAIIIPMLIIKIKWRV